MKISTLLYRISIFNRLRCYLARKRVAKGYKLRSNDEIFNIRKRIYDTMLAFDRVKNIEEKNRYQSMVDTLDWVIGAKNDLV